MNVRRDYKSCQPHTQILAIIYMYIYTPQDRTPTQDEEGDGEAGEGDVSEHDDPGLQDDSLDVAYDPALLDVFDGDREVPESIQGESSGDQEAEALESQQVSDTLVLISDDEDLPKEDSRPVMPPPRLPGKEAFVPTSSQNDRVALLKQRLQMLVSLDKLIVREPF